MKDISNGTQFHRRSLFLIVVAFLLILAGCGGSSSQSPTTNNTTPTPTTTPTASTPNTPTPPPSSGGSYLATMFLVADGSSAPPRGTVVMNAQADNGSGTLQISGGQPSTSYELHFCPGSQTTGGNCISIVTFSTDANGSANVSFQIPPGASASGQFVGTFFVFKDGNPIYTSGANAQATGVSFRAALLPGLPENPSGGGSISVSGQTLHVVLNGVPPNLNYEVLPCSWTAMGLRCNSFGTVTVSADAQGNGTRDFNLGVDTFVGFIEVKNQFNQRYESGFRAQ